MKILLALALLLPTIISSPAMADGSLDSYSIVQAKTQNQPKAQASYNKSSSDPNKIEINNFKFEMKACQRDGEDVICNLQLTSMATEEQSISLFADCSRVTNDQKEFGGFNAQIGQGSSATLSTGMSRQAFITFRGIKSSVNALETIEIAYSTDDGDGTIKFRNITIQ
jgi:hypothetical protein